jgi:hypothetical protein
MLGAPHAVGVVLLWGVVIGVVMHFLHGVRSGDL